MKAIVRAWVGPEHRLLFEETFEDIKASTIDAAIRRQMAMLDGHPLHLIEVEFPEEPEERRFFRFGTDTRGMVMPIPQSLLPGSDFTRN